MKVLTDLIQNPVFLSAGASWLVSQVAKILYESIRYGFRADRLAGGGGMPSSHTATVTGLIMGCVLSGRVGYPEFAIALFLGAVVIYDAVGVRYETGQQAKILNAMRERDLAEGREPLFDKPLNEKMGHTVPEVIVGALVGIAVSVVMCMWTAPLISSALAAV